MRYGDLTYLEIRDRAAAGWLAVVPTGCTEQQGPHLPVDFDSWLAETVCLAGAERLAEVHGLGALVLPVMPFGPTPEHRSYGGGFVHIPKRLHQALVRLVLESLSAQGFRRMVVWQGCGGHCLGPAVERFNAWYGDQGRAFLPPLPYQDLWHRLGDPQVPTGHADAFATSIALYLRPEAVRRDLIADPGSVPVDWNDPDLDFGRYSRSGVIGDPTAASAELGRKLWAALVDEVALLFRDPALGPL